MTKEQWLVYLWSIYPNGGFTFFWVISLFLFMCLLLISGINYYSYYNNSDSLWQKMGKWKIIIPSVLLVFIFISNLVPKREYFAYIIATPYVVDSGKGIVESLQDPNSKLSKLNSIMDKGLDKIINELDNKENKK